MSTVAIDWDDTLVGYKKYGEPGEWLPGATLVIRKFKRAGFTVVIHSCRASWEAGLEEIRTKLLSEGLHLGSKLKIHTEPGKPLAKLYIDDRGMHFPGDWTRVDIDELIRSLE